MIVRDKSRRVAKGCFGTGCSGFGASQQGIFRGPTALGIALSAFDTPACVNQCMSTHCAGDLANSNECRSECEGECLRQAADSGGTGNKGDVVKVDTTPPASPPAAYTAPPAAAPPVAKPPVSTDVGSQAWAFLSNSYLGVPALAWLAVGGIAAGVLISKMRHHGYSEGGYGGDYGY